MPVCLVPAIPAMELTVINKALMAEVSFKLLQPNSNNIGDNIIPPPMPIKPEIKPILTPKTKTSGMETGLQSQ